MAKLSTCLLVIIAMTLFLIELSQQALEYRFLPFENGKCIFNGEKVGVEQSTYEIKTCMQWTCYGKINSTHGKMRGASCGAVWAPPPCKVIPMRPGIHPKCCPKPSCPDKVIV
uniref:Putative kDa family member n=1 Tax=Rhipicephalus microplus TaxID=6941 RepID=A0A6G5A3N6_RHIMP